MAAPEGNQFWKARSSHGANPKFADAESLWEACCEYFEWVEANPLWESKVVQANGEPVDHPLPKMRAMTITGMCVYIDLDYSTWEEYRKREDLSRIARTVDAIIRDQKFAGAAAGLLNANIIARDLGLREATTNEHHGTDDKPPIQVEHSFDLSTIKQNVSDILKE